MPSITDLVLPVFGIVILGYAIAKAGYMTKEQVNGLASFVFLVAIPALIFRSLGHGLPEEIDFALLFAYFGVLFPIYGLTMLAGRLLFGMNRREQAITAMTACFSNMILLALPIVSQAFGPQGLLAVLMLIVVQSTTLIAGTTVLMESGAAMPEDGRRRGLLAVGWSAMVSSVRNPILMALFIGVAVSLSGIGIDPRLDKVLELLTRASTPCALFALGASLAYYRVSGDLKVIGMIVTIKGLLVPAAVWFMAGIVFRLPSPFLEAAVVTAAMPSGANPYILANRYGVGVGRAASSLLVTTGLSIVTVSLLLGLFLHR